MMDKTKIAAELVKIAKLLTEKTAGSKPPRRLLSDLDKYLKKIERSARFSYDEERLRETIEDFISNHKLTPKDEDGETDIDQVIDWSDEISDDLVKKWGPILFEED